MISKKDKGFLFVRIPKFTAQVDMIVGESLKILTIAFCRRSYV